MQLEQLKFPIGVYQTPQNITPEILRSAIHSIEYFPSRLKEVTEGFTEEQYLTPYRPGGWTVKQLINHCADSHMNSLIRFKWCLTEETPKIKTYDQDSWANLPDSESIPVDFAFQMLAGIHGRLCYLLKTLDKTALNLSLIHI